MGFPVDNRSYTPLFRVQAFALENPLNSLVEAAAVHPVEIAISHRKLSMKLLRSVLKCVSFLRSSSTFRMEWITVE